MKQKYVPLEKRSKRQQKEYHSEQRKDWGNLNPVTRKNKNLKAHQSAVWAGSRDRKKTGQWSKYEPFPVFCWVVIL